MRFKLYSMILIVTVLFILSSMTLYSQSYEIKVKFKTYKNNPVYLGFHYGNNKYIRDTAEVNNKGIVVFSGEEALPGGIYLIIVPNKNYFELILNENKIYVETDTGDFVKNMRVIESKENEVFYEYLHFMQDIHFERTSIQQEYNDLEASDSLGKQKIKDELIRIDEKVFQRRKQIINENPNLFFSTVVQAMQEPLPRDKMTSETDSVYRNYLYGFYQEHFFDNIDLSNQNIIRTPIYEAKIDRFVEKLTIRHPDSIKFAAQRIIDKSMANEEVFKYTLIKLFNKYARSQYMGMDAVVVHLAERYYLSGKASWADSTQIAKIYERVVNLSSNLIGMKAPELIMQDTSKQYRSLHSLKSKYTVLLFWDVSCSHCKQIMPELKEFINRTPSDSVQVFAVYLGKDIKEWKKFLIESKLPFIHVSDPQQFSNFRTLYDVYSTPVIYLIDEDKIIQAKRIAVDKIEPIINTLEKRFDLVKTPIDEIEKVQE